MRIRNILLFTLIIHCILICSCTPIRKPLDERVGFSTNLSATESYIRNADWDSAVVSLESTKKSWHNIKPVLQLDIDHDYINDIENNIEKLKAYLETKQKPDSLSIILELLKSWKDIGQM